jgi:hypothetical protein
LGQSARCWFISAAEKPLACVWRDLSRLDLSVFFQSCQHLRVTHVDPASRDLKPRELVSSLKHPEDHVREFILAPG